MSKYLNNEFYYHKTPQIKFRKYLNDTIFWKKFNTETENRCRF